MNGTYHVHLINIFGCPSIVHGEMNRIMTPLWVLVYLIITPVICFKYTADFMLAFLEDQVFQHLDPCVDSEKSCLPSSTFRG